MISGLFRIYYKQKSIAFIFRRRGEKKMNLNKETILKGAVKELFFSARCSFVPLGNGYFEGVKTVLEYTDRKILLQFKNGEAEIVGEKLGIDKYCDGDVGVSGCIQSVVFTPKGEKNK